MNLSDELRRVHTACSGISVKQDAFSQVLVQVGDATVLPQETTVLDKLDSRDDLDSESVQELLSVSTIDDDFKEGGVRAVTGCALEGVLNSTAGSDVNGVLSIELADGVRGDFDDNQFASILYSFRNALGEKVGFL